ncbi:MAG: PD-(D/E)XK nuclease family protein, partial [Rhodobacteraceae bacterium]|nr:PD-(D/E)XK nuclease family protein [Paracoccaceae bacterium]
GAALLAEAEGLISDPALEWIFTPDALAEVPVAGRVEALGGRVIRGQIDRLIVTQDHIWAVDFKSDAVPPPADAPLPPAYERQLALYVLALRQIYPGRPVRAGVLWTSARRLTEMNHDAVNAALASHGAY